MSRTSSARGFLVLTRRMHADDIAILDRFERQSIPRAEWTHRMHVRVGWCMLERHGLAGAIARMRDGVCALNEANGVANTPDDGYHETITIAWLRVIDAARRAAPTPTSAVFLDRHADLLRTDRLLAHYTRAQLMSREARARWVEPDLAPLPG